jgi:hypothetical protein
MQVVAAMLALLVAATGWHYLFYSKAAHRLSAVENLADNARRVRLRRINGVVMILLGVAFCAGFYAVEWEPPKLAFACIWAAVLLLLLAVVVLAFLDVRLTFKLKSKPQQGSKQ